VKESDTEVVWCGFGEPTVRLGIVLSLTRRIKVEYPHMGVRLDTDGLAQFRSKEREVASELKEAGVDSVSISLNADNESKYNELCRPALPESYQAVLRFARDCKKHFSKIRLTVPSVPSVDIDRCARIAEELGCEFKVR